MAPLFVDSGALFYPLRSFLFRFGVLSTWVINLGAIACFFRLINEDAGAALTGPRSGQY
jgi:hypothetical protein